MSASELILVVLIAMGAFWAGYRIGRASVLAPGRSPEPVDAAANPPGKDVPSEPSATHSRPRGAPPPASAGGEDAAASGRENSVSSRRRSTKPPPAAAGLLDTGDKRPPKPSG